MPGVVLYFQIHQPCRLRRYSVFDQDGAYFDDAGNAEIVRRVAEKCYRPALRRLRDAVTRHAVDFRFAFSVTATALGQLVAHAPDVIDLLRALADTGRAEVLAETSHHSLASLRSPCEFAAQVGLHAGAVRAALGVAPRVFRNTELIYDDALADTLRKHAFAGCLAEGVDRILRGRPEGGVYRPPGVRRKLENGREFGLLLRCSRLSDDIAFRFSRRDWEHWPLTPEKFAGWVADSPGPLCNLFMDLETFGEHQWADTGILGFLAALPGAILARKDCPFLTPSEAIAVHDPAGEYGCPHPTSWADTERDVSAWCGNAMQEGALAALYRLERPVKQRLEHAQRRGDEPSIAQAAALLESWRRLTTSDHYYYMSTKGASDGAVHAYFSPYDSPYDAYINVMNVIEDLARRAGAEPATRAVRAR